jgi:hypothetical protein
VIEKFAAATLAHAKQRQRDRRQQQALGSRAERVVAYLFDINQSHERILSSEEGIDKMNEFLAALKAPADFPIKRLSMKSFPNRLPL